MDMKGYVMKSKILNLMANKRLASTLLLFISLLMPNAVLAQPSNDDNYACSHHSDCRHYESHHHQGCRHHHSHHSRCEHHHDCNDNHHENCDHRKEHHNDEHHYCQPNDD